MVSEGDRVELIYTDDPYTNLEQARDSSVEEGTKGTVTGTEVEHGSVTKSGNPKEKVWVDWDNGSRLALIVGEDVFRVLDS